MVVDVDVEYCQRSLSYPYPTIKYGEGYEQMCVKIKRHDSVHLLQTQEYGW